MTASIINGESGASVREKLNEVIDKVNEFEFSNSSANVLVRPEVNYLDPTASWSVISGGGGTGSSSRFIEGSGATNRNEIGANASYVAGTAGVATIAGGYDHRNDQLAGTISGGGHNLLNYEGDHGTIAGGSHNSVVGASSYVVISGGTLNVIGEDGIASLTTISGGRENKIKTGTIHSISGGRENTIEGGGGRSVIGGGFQNTIDSTSDQNVICGGGGNSITGATTNAVIAGGSSNATAATGSFIASGRNHSIESGGLYSFVCGDTNEVLASGAYSSSFGLNASAYIQGSLNFSSQSFLSVKGSCQGITLTLGRQTTDDTVTQLTLGGSSSVPIPSGNSAWSGVITVVGRERDSTNVAMWRWEFGIAKSTGNLIIKYGGTAPTALVDDITCAAVPSIRSGTSAFRLDVAGKAATSIDWAARVDIVQTRQ